MVVNSGLSEYKHVFRNDREGKASDVLCGHTVYLKADWRRDSMPAVKQKMRCEVCGRGEGTWDTYMTYQGPARYPEGTVLVWGDERVG